MDCWRGVSCLDTDDRLVHGIHPMINGKYFRDTGTGEGEQSVSLGDTFGVYNIELTNFGEK